MSSAASNRKAQTKLRGGVFDVPIIHTLYQTYSLWSDLMVKFPKSQRYTLGETCQQHLLALIEAVIVAASSSRPEVKAAQLRAASAKLDILRLLVRLAKDNKCLSHQAYIKMESELHEAGRMPGGWLKSL